MNSHRGLAAEAGRFQFHGSGSVTWRNDILEIENPLRSLTLLVIFPLVVAVPALLFASLSPFWALLAPLVAVVVAVACAFGIDVLLESHARQSARDIGPGPMDIEARDVLHLMMHLMSSRTSFPSSFPFLKKGGRSSVEISGTIDLHRTRIRMHVLTPDLEIIENFSYRPGADAECDLLVEAVFRHALNKAVFSGVIARQDMTGRTPLSPRLLQSRPMMQGMPEIAAA